MTELFINLGRHLEIIARAGGGGSGGGGGGGGGSGGGEGIVIIGLIGYFPAYYASRWCNRHDLHTWWGYGLGFIAGLVPTVLMALLSGLLAFIVLIGAVVGAYSGMHDFHARLRGKFKRSKEHLMFAASKDAVWDETAITARAIDVFNQFQKDWTEFNVENMRSYLSPAYHAHVSLMMLALAEMGRQNVVSHPRILENSVVEVRDEPINDNDHFQMYFRAQADDTLIQSPGERIIYVDDSQFSEIWTFDREGDTWVLEGIMQVTESAWSLNASMKDFATENSMYFSPDWGWLLLPEHGELFSKADFTRSDINNHVIGDWDGLLVQLYTYVPSKRTNRRASYMVGQITLPKYYGGIIIKRKNMLDLFSKAPSGYQKISFEWPDFNRRYVVYATDADKVTSFELLNPAFMAELYDMDTHVSIEVVDNVVYLYILENQASFTVTSYRNMMAILKRSYRELRK